jgi:hypothetical protein
MDQLSGGRSVLQEGLAGICHVLLDGTQQAYCDAYGKADYQLKRAQGDNIFISSSPRLLEEALAMVMIAVLAYALSRYSGGINTGRYKCLVKNH